MGNEKYKVLIADDEYWTREKLCRMIQWERYSLELLAPASDGEEVLRRMEEEQPDILITDINMPYVDGVELQKRVHEQYPEVVTFVISGYDDFEYVKASFLSGSVNYLLKPVSKIDLVNALSKALEQISEKRSRKLELQKASSLIMDREFSRLLEKQEAAFTPSITMNSRIDFAGVGLILIKIHDLHQLTGIFHYDQNLLSWSVKKKLREMAGNGDTMYVFNHIYRSNEFLIITEQEQQGTSSLAGRIASYFGRQADSPVTVVLSGHSYSLESIHRAYTEVISRLMTRRFCRENEILFCEEKSDVQRKKIETRFNDAQSQELRHLLRRGQTVKAKRYVRETVGLGYLAGASSHRYVPAENDVAEKAAGRNSENDVTEKAAGRKSENDVAEKAAGRNSGNDVAEKAAGRNSENDVAEKAVGRIPDDASFSEIWGGTGKSCWLYLEVRQTVKKILSLIQEIYAEHMGPGDAVAMEGLTDLADKVVEQLDADYLCEVIDDAIDFAASLQQDVMAETTRGLVKQAAAYIDEHYCEELTLSSLAEQFHVENSYFSRLFRQETGENVMLYIARTRVEQAKRYMAEGKKNLTEIAFLTGYDDYTYFNRVFRKITGKSPRDYRSELSS